jgi:chromosome segregation ATPase
LHRFDQEREAQIRALAAEKAELEKMQNDRTVATQAEIRAMQERVASTQHELQQATQRYTQVNTMYEATLRHLHQREAIMAHQKQQQEQAAIAAANEAAVATASGSASPSIVGMVSSFTSWFWSDTTLVQAYSGIMQLVAWDQ